jgi:acyl transferase domain-containing protein
VILLSIFGVLERRGTAYAERAYIFTCTLWCWCGSSLKVKPVVDLPEYSFDKTLTYWHESRISRDWRLREEPTRSLLGVRTSDWNPLQPRWRKMLRVEEVPWIADHVVGNTIVFPAVGSIVMAIDAVRQTARGEREIRGYHEKEATFMIPVVIPAGQAAEVMTHLRPLQEP